MSFHRTPSPTCGCTIIEEHWEVVFYVCDEKICLECVYLGEVNLQLFINAVTKAKVLLRVKWFYVIFLCFQFLFPSPLSVVSLATTEKRIKAHRFFRTLQKAWPADSGWSAPCCPKWLQRLPPPLGFKSCLGSLAHKDNFHIVSLRGALIYTCAHMDLCAGSLLFGSATPWLIVWHRILHWSWAHHFS